MFTKALPVFLKGRETEINCTAVFRGIFDAKTGQSFSFRGTASTLYRVFLNGKLIVHGPARAAHGYFRVDEIDITPFVKEGKNVVAVEVAGYNCDSFWLMNQPSFLQAEILSGDEVILATGREGDFLARFYRERAQKVHRFSYQRTFVEGYDFPAEGRNWRTDPDVPFAAEAVEIVEAKHLLPRNLPPYRFGNVPVEKLICRGDAVLPDVIPQPIRMEREYRVREVGIVGFPQSEIPEFYVNTVNAIQCTVRETEPALSALGELKQNTYAIAKLPINKTGFLSFRLKCTAPTRLYITFDELLMDGDVCRSRMGTASLIRCAFEAGEYDFLSMEPYTMQYIKIVVLDGDCSVEGLSVVPLETPVEITAAFETDDPILRGVYDAGVETFRQNAVDVYMDCPSRERAGWLCDSFFTARSEYALTGKVAIERNFLENYMMSPKFDCLPDGMLPMCYPSDPLCGEYLPQWVLWLIVELGEYEKRTGDRALIDGFREKVYGIIRFFEQFKNEVGLLEKITGWVFIEWSHSQHLMQDINFPTNMLYAAALKTAASLYGDGALSERADEIIAEVRRLSLRKEPVSGKVFFADRALRQNGEIVVTDDFTEVCQYYAFYFGAASPETDSELWRTLVEEFGPHRVKEGGYPGVHAANAFTGNYIRLDLLYENGLRDQVLRETDGYYSEMVKQTGTLWENNVSFRNASCNHGFASHVCRWLLNA